MRVSLIWWKGEVQWFDFDSASSTLLYNSISTTNAHDRSEKIMRDEGASRSR